MDGEAPGLCILDTESENCDFCNKLLRSTSSAVTLAVPHRSTPFSEQPFHTPARPAIRNLPDTTEIVTSSRPPATPDPPLHNTAPLAPICPPQTDPIQAPEQTFSPTAAHTSKNPRTSLVARAPEQASPIPLRPVRRGGDGASICSDLRSFARAFRQWCIPCKLLLGESRQALGHTCSALRGRCLRCFGLGHFVAACPTPKRRDRHCFTCFMNYILGVPVHMGSFAWNCELAVCKNLCSALWNLREDLRQDLPTNVFTDAEMTKYHDAKPTWTNQIDQTRFFNQWLFGDGVTGTVPPIARVSLWWGRKENII